MTGICEVCGRPRGDLQSWFAAIPGPHPAASTICGRGSINIATDVECYRLGHDWLRRIFADAAEFLRHGTPIFAGSDLALEIVDYVDGLHTKDAATSRDAAGIRHE